MHSFQFLFVIVTAQRQEYFSSLFLILPSGRIFAYLLSSDMRLVGDPNNVVSIEDETSQVNMTNDSK